MKHVERCNCQSCYVAHGIGLTVPACNVVYNDQSTATRTFLLLLNQTLLCNSVLLLSTLFKNTKYYNIFRNHFGLSQ